MIDTVGVVGQREIGNACSTSEWRVEVRLSMPSRNDGLASRVKQFVPLSFHGKVGIIPESNGQTDEPLSPRYHVPGSKGLETVRSVLADLNAIKLTVEQYERGYAVYRGAWPSDYLKLTRDEVFDRCMSALISWCENEGLHPAEAAAYSIFYHGGNITSFYANGIRDPKSEYPEAYEESILSPLNGWVFVCTNTNPRYSRDAPGWLAYGLGMVTKGYSHDFLAGLSDGALADFYIDDLDVDPEAETDAVQTLQAEIDRRGLTPGDLSRAGNVLAAKQSRLRCRIIDGLRQPTTVFEAAVWHHTIKVCCVRCPNNAIFDAAGVWWHLQRRYGDLPLRDAHNAFYCFSCSRSAGRRIRSRAVELVRDEPSRLLPAPNDRDWKRALSRFKT